MIFGTRKNCLCRIHVYILRSSFSTLKLVYDQKEL